MNLPVTGRPGPVIDQLGKGMSLRCVGPPWRSEVRSPGHGRIDERRDEPELGSTGVSPGDVLQREGTWVTDGGGLIAGIAAGAVSSGTVPPVLMTTSASVGSKLSGFTVSAADGQHSASHTAGSAPGWRALCSGRAGAGPQSRRYGLVFAVGLAKCQRVVDGGMPTGRRSLSWQQHRMLLHNGAPVGHVSRRIGGKREVGDYT